MTFIVEIDGESLFYVHDADLAQIDDMRDQAESQDLRWWVVDPKTQDTIESSEPLFRDPVIDVSYREVAA